MRMAQALLLVSAISVLAVVAGPFGVASAAADVTITSPVSGSTTTDSTPTFKGTAEAGGGDVTVTISPIGGEGTETTQPVSPSGTGSWKVTAPHLQDGTYSAVATQEPESIQSTPVTFTVETPQAPSPPPHVTIAYPANGSTNTSGTEPVGGLAGTVAEGDEKTVTVQLFSGATIGAQQALEALTVPASEGVWSGAFGGLGAGTYTIRAEQSNSHGVVGTSATATFTVVIPAGPAPPAASFQWFPPFPSTGENVSLVSSSTDTASPITSFAWALTATGLFQTGKPVLVTSFAAPGAHSVRLRVTDGNGLSSIATETITVKSSPLILMQPFPIVRIAGSETHSGVRIRLLTAEAPPGAHITVRCKGRGCPVKAAKRIAVSSKTGAAPLTFHTFERSLRAGLTLEILIYKSGEIGKYTRLVIRRGRLPERVDMCLDPTGLKPLVCPSS
jgi:Bacterial Ig-like domain